MSTKYNVSICIIHHETGEIETFYFKNFLLLFLENGIDVDLSDLADELLKKLCPAIGIKNNLKNILKKLLLQE